MTFTSPSFTVELEEEWFLSFPRYFKGTVVVFSSDSPFLEWQIRQRYFKLPPKFLEIESLGLFNFKTCFKQI